MGTHEVTVRSDREDVDDLTKEFLTESLEGLDRMERCLTELEVRPDDAECLNEIFRAVHTIKGTTGFLGFVRLEKLVHAGETLLGSLREGRLSADEGLVSALLRLMDRLREILRLIEATGGEGVRERDEDSALIEHLLRLNEGGPSSGPTEEITALRVGSQGALDGSEKTLRVDVDVMNRLMNEVGELVLTRNQILQRYGGEESFAQLGRRLDHVTAELRETVMEARMQPVGHVFGKFPRLVRDLAKTCGKKVRIEFAGLETGLDKSLLEAIKDPLTHAVRNAVDHGVEKPEVRVMAGKPAEGVIRLQAYQRSGAVVIELSDDGAGMSKWRLVAKALEKKLISEERAVAIGDSDEALQLIFLPGFSTAGEVTNVSGRGVGMDVVRSNVEKAGGTVEVQSTEGRGTVLRMKVPLTLAIVPALVVLSGGQSFCLPQSALAELVYVPKRDARAAVDWMGETQVYRLRDRLLPMVWLDEVMGLDGRDTRQEHGFYLAVVEAEGCRYGMAVDDLLAPEEIVVKPLSAVLRDVGVFSGATVLGNGTLAMILDVPAVAGRVGVWPVAEKLRQGEMEHLEKGIAAVPTFLIFDQQLPGEQVERMALPLSVVERIEEVEVKEVEYAGGRPILQYRGEVIPLEDGGGVVEGRRKSGPDECVTVLICKRPGAVAGRRSGLVVGHVVDVASGAMLPADDEVMEVELALVKGRLTTVRKEPEEMPSMLASGPWLSDFGQGVDAGRVA